MPIWDPVRSHRDLTGPGADRVPVAEVALGRPHDPRDHALAAAELVELETACEGLLTAGADPLGEQTRVLDRPRLERAHRLG